MRAAGGTVAVFAGQHATAERRPRRETEAKGLARLHQLGLCGAFDEAVLELQRRDRQGAADLGDGGSACHAPGREVREPRVEDLAFAREVVESAQQFFHRRDTVGVVRPEQVDVVGLQPSQALLHRTDHCLATVAGHEDSGRRVCPLGELGGEHELVASTLQQPAEDLLGLAELIAVGGVEEVAARVGIGIENLRRRVRRRTMTPAGTEVAGTEDDLGDAQPRVLTEDPVAQGSVANSVVTHCFSRPVEICVSK
ncbi:Uncharacterised protein [Mycobacteroides abscessus subsp. abscessus]|nr:Uncharacterised protein [Mycobacteroides abscessus subsp. abscessus]